MERKSEMNIIENIRLILITILLGLILIFFLELFSINISFWIIILIIGALIVSIIVKNPEKAKTKNSNYLKNFITILIILTIIFSLNIIIMKIDEGDKNISENTGIIKISGTGLCAIVDKDIIFQDKDSNGNGSVFNVNFKDWHTPVMIHTSFRGDSRSFLKVNIIDKKDPRKNISFKKVHFSNQKSVYFATLKRGRMFAVLDNRDISPLDDLLVYPIEGLDENREIDVVIEVFISPPIYPDDINQVTLYDIELGH